MFFGVGLEFKFGRKQHKLTTSLLFPLRSKSFNDNEEEDNPIIGTISIGFLFAF